MFSTVTKFSCDEKTYDLYGRMSDDTVSMSVWDDTSKVAKISYSAPDILSDEEETMREMQALMAKVAQIDANLSRHRLTDQRPPLLLRGPGIRQLGRIQDRVRHAAE